MKTYDVVLTKSYIVRVKAPNEGLAKEFCELYTNDIKDISSNEDRVDLNFEIENIECTINQTFGVEEVYE
ncbi:MAG: hypothetical protein A2086_14155 [Spirochaetes bacterium GWD1_27_9]|nr:MAG: hypothetical protein A2Z98_14640 [Spirochaetes bacterium GWB1_27_13]OHD25714.1 MAG: hypothetical protein A2Y34_13085 [Spirochaetes bacterium GWC1_27_15]OHD29961.1 MAG: hypothetical protein A2086_14155 [Spirochaetes bacterium GWD1_27_9]